MVWQSLALFPFLNARENVEFGLKMRGLDKPKRRAKALDWLERLGIGEFAERDVNSLSGGQRQRVALARALVTEPKILLLDEPLSALDAHLVIRMQGVLTKLQRELGITFVYVTHSQSEAFAMADRVVIMSKGEIAQIGSARDIYRTPANRFVAEFVGRNNIFSGTVECGRRRRDAGRHIRTRFQGQARRAGELRRRGRRGVRSPPRRPAARNVFSGQLISEEFVGSMVTLFFEAADGMEVKVQVQERLLEGIPREPGQQLFLSFDPSHAHVLKG